MIRCNYGIAACVLSLLCLSSLEGSAATASGWLPQGAGVTEVDLRTLSYGDNIPGFHETPAVNGGDGALVELDVPRHDGTSASRIESHWQSNDNLNFVEIHVVVYPSQQAARDGALHLVRGSQSPKIEMPLDVRIGDASWMGGGFRTVVLGRVLSWVNVLPLNRRSGAQPDNYRISVLDGLHDEIADTLARGIEWAIRQRQDLLAGADAAERRTVQAASPVRVRPDKPSPAPGLSPSATSPGHRSPP